MFAHSGGLACVSVSRFSVPCCSSRLAGAVCPSRTAFAGGGPAATDCIVTWSGIAGARHDLRRRHRLRPGRHRGRRLHVPAPGLPRRRPQPAASTAMTSVRVTPREAGGAARPRSAMEALAPGQCTAPGFAVPVKPSAGLEPIKPGVAQDQGGGGRGRQEGSRQAEAHVLSRPRPSFADRRAADPHAALRHRGAVTTRSLVPRAQALDAGEAYANIVGKPSTEGGKLLVVAPAASPRASWPARSPARASSWRTAR